MIMGPLRPSLTLPPPAVIRNCRRRPTRSRDVTAPGDCVTRVAADRNGPALLRGLTESALNWPIRASRVVDMRLGRAGRKVGVGAVPDRVHQLLGGFELRQVAGVLQELE